MALQPSENNTVAQEHRTGHNLFSFQPAALGEGHIRMHYRDRNIRGSTHDPLPGNTFLVTLEMGHSDKPARKNTWNVIQKEIVKRVEALDTSSCVGTNAKGQMIIGIAADLDGVKPLLSGDALVSLFANLEETIKTPEDVQKLQAQQQDAETKYLAAKHEHERQGEQSEQGSWVAATTNKKMASKQSAVRG